MFKIRKYLIFVGILVSLLIFVLLVTKKKPLESKEDLLPVIKIEKPTIQNLQESIQINGYVEAKSMIPVVPFVSGTIMEYPVNAGDFVKKDTLLAKIDDEPFIQQMKQAEAAYFAAENSFNRVANLFKVVLQLSKITIL